MAAAREQVDLERVRAAAAKRGFYSCSGEAVGKARGVGREMARDRGRLSERTKRWSSAWLDGSDLAAQSVSVPPGRAATMQATGGGAGAASA